MFQLVGLTRLAAKRCATSRLYSTKFNKKFSVSGNYVLGISGAILIGGLSYYLGQQSIISNPPRNLFSNSSTTRISDLEPPKYCSEEEFEKAVQEIKAVLGESNVKNTKAELDHHTTNTFTIIPLKDNERPKSIVYPGSTEEVSEVMKIIFKYSVPVVPYSGGTSLEGNFHSTRPGVLLNLSRMNKVIEVHQDDLDAVVQGGVGWVDLNKQLEPLGLMLGCDCGVGAHISGMINTNASGVNASRYGAMKENVVSITAVLADGTIIKTKQRPRKSSSGYNLTGLFVGSEGTLGIITEATVKLHVKPKYETVAVVQFPTIADTTNAVTKILQAGIQVDAVELMDKDMMKCVNYSGLVSKKWLETPTLFFKIGGLNKVVVNELVNEIKLISKESNSYNFVFAKNKQELDELFSVRKNAFYAMLDYGYNEIDESVKLWVTDIAVPLSRLSPVLSEIDEDFKKSGFQTAILGHVGDSNFHADIYYKPEDFQKCKDLVSRMVELGLKNEGTATGEHGIGIGKRKFLQMELGDDAIDLMRKLKLSLDPKDCLNPDKIFKIDPNDKIDT